MSLPLPTRQLLPWTGNEYLALLVQAKAPFPLPRECEEFYEHTEDGRRFGPFTMNHRLKALEFETKWEAYPLKHWDECVVGGVLYIVVGVQHQFVRRTNEGIEYDTVFTVQPVIVRTKTDL